MGCIELWSQIPGLPIVEWDPQNTELGRESDGGPTQDIQLCCHVREEEDSNTSPRRTGYKKESTE